MMDTMMSRELQESPPMNLRDEILINIAKDNSVSSHPCSPAWLFILQDSNFHRKQMGMLYTGAVAFLQKSEEVIRSPGTVIMVMSCRVSAGNRAQVFQKSSQCS